MSETTKAFLEELKTIHRKIDANTDRLIAIENERLIRQLREVGCHPTVDQATDDWAEAVKSGNDEKRHKAAQDLERAIEAQDEQYNTLPTYKVHEWRGKTCGSCVYFKEECRNANSGCYYGPDCGVVEKDTHACSKWEQR